MTPAERTPDTDTPDAEENPLEELSGLHKMSAPDCFEANVTETIRRRSGGRFFGPKRLGDRVPFVLLAVVALLLGLLAFAVLRASDTGSLRYHKKPGKPAINPAAPGQMPRPR